MTRDDGTATMTHPYYSRTVVTFDAVCERNFTEMHNFSGVIPEMSRQRVRRKRLLSISRVYAFDSTIVVALDSKTKRREH